MPEQFPPYRRKIVGGTEDARALRAELDGIHDYLQRLANFSQQLDEDRGGITSADGTDLSGGGGGGGGTTPDAVPTHGLLSDTHSDTADADPVAGDLIYADSTPEWNRLAKGTDGDVLTMVSGAPAWDAPASTGTGKAPLLSFAKGNISLFTGSDSLLKNCWTKATTDEIPELMPAAGTIDYLTAALDGDVGGVGDDVILTLYKNGVATAMSVTITGGAGTEQYSYPGTGGPVSFVAGDVLAIYGKKNGSPGARELKVMGWGTLD